MQDFGILPDFAGIVVSDRYVNYFHARWEHIAGHQACLSHILRDLEDCAETYPDALWPAQAQRALRGLIHAWNDARDAGPGRDPRRTRGAAGAPSSAAPSPSAWPPCPASPARRTPPHSTPAATCWNSAATAKPTCSRSPPIPGLAHERSGFILHLLWWLESTGVGGMLRSLSCWWFQYCWGV